MELVAQARVYLLACAAERLGVKKKFKKSFTT